MDAMDRMAVPQGPSGRPGSDELARLVASGWRQAPWLPVRPVFPVLFTQEYAERIARYQDVPQYGYVTRFRTRRAFADRYRHARWPGRSSRGARYRRTIFPS